MATPIDILHDASGDIDITQGVRLTSDLKTFVKQKLGERLVWFLGEWFLDTRKGLPYFRVAIGQRYDARLVESVFRRACELTPGVGSVKRLVSQFDRAHRTLFFPVGEVMLTTGEVLPIDYILDVP